MLKSNGLHRLKIQLIKFGFSPINTPANIAKKLPLQCCSKPLLIPFFNFLHKWPTFAFTPKAGTHSAFGEGLHTRAHTPKQEPSLLRSQCGFVPSVKFFLFRHTFIYIHFPVLCEPHYISRGKNSGKVAAISFIPNRFSFRFSTSRTNGSRSLSQTKASTHSAFGEKSHTSAYTAKHGAFRMGALLLPSERSTRFGNPAWPGFKTANFAAFGSWSETLLKNAESLRSSDAHDARRCSEASRPRWAA